VKYHPRKTATPPSRVRPDEAEAIDAAKAAALETLKPLVTKNPARTLKSLLPAELERMVIAAISGWIVTRSTQAKLLGVSVDSLDDHIRLNDPLPDILA
jgi:hypothetical protein